MKRINNKEKGSIFPKLVVSYFTFLIIAFIGMFVGGFLLLLIESEGDTNKLIPSQHVAEDGTLDDLTILYRSGGWVEKMTPDYEVVEVYGDKKTESYRYSQKELLEITRTDIVDAEYLFFYEPFEGGSYLFCYPKSRLRVTFTYDIKGLTSTNQQKVLLLLMCLFLSVDGILISMYIYRKIRLPLKQLISGMQRMEAGERDFNLNFRAEGEFAALREAFNRMLIHVKHEENEKVKLQQDRHQMLLELSHDLKSPIATINNCSFALKEGVVTEEERDKYYQMIAAKTSRVNEMADDMFTMLKMESDNYEPQLERLDFCEFIRQVCAEYYAELEQAGLEIDIEIPETAIYVKGDETLLRRAIGNLLINVVKYNHLGKYVLIKVFRQDEKIMLIVADDGIPIDETLSRKLFSPFVRGEDSQKQSGTGLGLAIARAVISKHKGEIYYQYESGRNEFVVVLEEC